MLSDEEKKAVDTIKILIQYLNVWKENFTIAPEDVKYLDPIINLIEKQSKEIEELKAKNKILEAISLSFNEIQDRDKKWEDKIKAKIEELKDGTFDAKIVLQSLLEKE